MAEYNDLDGEPVWDPERRRNERWRNEHPGREPEESRRGQPWPGESRPADFDAPGDWGRQGSWGTYGNRGPVNREDEWHRRQQGFGPSSGVSQWGGGAGQYGQGTGRWGGEREERGGAPSYGPGSYGGGVGSYSGGIGPRRGPFAGRGPKGYHRSDERIREDVSDRLTDHPDIDATEIEVTVHEGRSDAVRHGGRTEHETDGGGCGGIGFRREGGS